MKYSIIRDGETVLIGHSNSVYKDTVRALEKAVDEIEKRMRWDVMNGVTYASPRFVELRADDVIRMEYPSGRVKFVTVGARGGIKDCRHCFDGMLAEDTDYEDEWPFYQGRELDDRARPIG